MKYSEKEIQYILSHYPGSFFPKDFQVIGSEVSVPLSIGKNKRGRIDILGKDKSGYIIIEIKKGFFDVKASSQLASYIPGVNEVWGKVSKTIGVSPKGFNTNNSKFEKMLISENQLDDIVKRSNLDFKSIFPDSEVNAVNILNEILNYCDTSQLNKIFGKLLLIENYKPKHQRPAVLDLTKSAIQIDSKINTSSVNSKGADLVLNTNKKSIHIECKVSANFGKGQLFKYKSSLKDNEYLIFIGNNLRQYNLQLFENKVPFISWDTIFEVVSSFKNIPPILINELNNYRYHFYQSLLTESFTKVSEFLLSKGYPLNIIPKEKITDKEYSYKHFKTDSLPQEFKKPFTFIFGIHASKCNRFNLRPLNPDDKYSDYPLMKKFVKEFLLESKINVVSHDINVSDEFSFDMSNIRKKSDLDDDLVRRLSSFIEEKIEYYIKIMNRCL